MGLNEKLNLGCGQNAKPDWLNVDVQKWDGVDLVADIRSLHFLPESFTQIAAIDILEHITFEDAKKLLKRCFSWLKPGGTLTLHVPNMHYLALQLSVTHDYNRLFSLEVLKWIYGCSGEGKENYPQNFHRWGYSKQSLSEILEKIGYKIIRHSITCDGFGLLMVASKT